MEKKKNSLFPCPFMYCDQKTWEYDASRSSFIGFSAFPYEVEYSSFKVGEKFCWNIDRHNIAYVECCW